MAKLPKAPQHEGVDPLTKSPTYHSPENVKDSSTLNQQMNDTEPTKQDVQAEETVQAQEERAADPAGAKADSDSTTDEGSAEQDTTTDSKNKTSARSK